MVGGVLTCIPFYLFLNNLQWGLYHISTDKSLCQYKQSINYIKTEKKNITKKIPGEHKSISHLLSLVKCAISKE